jgi:hypothetical protein
LTDVTEEEKEQAAIAAAVRLVEEQNKKEVLLKDTYESGLDPKTFDEMYEKIPPREEPLDPSQTIYGIFNGKTPDILVHNRRSLDVFRKNHFPPLVKVKRVFDRFFQGVNSLEESNLSENQPTSNPFNSIMYIPSESNIYSHNAASSSGNIATSNDPEHDDDQDSERTLSLPPHSPKNDSVIQDTNNEESQQPTPNQQKPQTPPFIPSSEHNSPPPEQHNSPPPEHHHSPQTEHQSTPPPENTVSSDEVVVDHPLGTTVIDADKSPQHVDDFNTSTLDTPLKERFQQLHKELFSEVTSPPNNLQAFMQKLSDNCIVARLDLPSRIANEPLTVSQR